MNFLMVNVCDLQACGSVGGLGSPLHLMIRRDLGDELLEGHVKGKNADDLFLVVQATPERCEAIQGGLEVVGRRKLRRKIRTKIRKTKPAMEGT